MNRQIAIHGIWFLLCLSGGAFGQNKPDKKLYPILDYYVKELYTEFKDIPEDRRYRLDRMVDYLFKYQNSIEPTRLFFIGQHQATVSQMSQVWARTAAYYFGIGNIQYFSGGITEDPIDINVITSLERAGFIVYKVVNEGFVTYEVKYGYGQPSMTLFSKKMKHRANPLEGFLAVVVSPNANLNLHFIKGSIDRIALDYNDPLSYVGTGDEMREFDKQNHIIAVDMFYVFSRLKRKMKDAESQQQ